MTLHESLYRSCLGLACPCRNHSFICPFLSPTMMPEAIQCTCVVGFTKSCSVDHSGPHLQATASLHQTPRKRRCMYGLYLCTFFVAHTLCQPAGTRRSSSTGTCTQPRQAGSHCSSGLVNAVISGLISALLSDLINAIISGLISGLINAVISAL